MKTSWALGLRGSDWAAPFLALERMYSDQDPSYEVTDHTPPLHQYLNEDDEPVINFNVATIKGREGMEVVEERPAGGDDVEQDDFLRGDGDVDEDDVSCRS
ncbi:MAG: hypothetical protein Q9161_003114 [Pseudevernia consocians]